MTLTGHFSRASGITVWLVKAKLCNASSNIISLLGMIACIVIVMQIYLFAVQHRLNMVMLQLSHHLAV